MARSKYLPTLAESYFVLTLFRMDHYRYTRILFDIWNNGVKRYQDGHTKCENFFAPDETAFIHSIGASEQEVFDFVEDFARNGEEPDFGTFATLQDIRRAYFLEVQDARPSSKMLDPETLPDKKAELDGISWLPRILVKAKAKLQGELHPNVMYSCGGDRRFFKEHNLHPAEFLRKVWQAGDDHQAILKWVKKRSTSDAGSCP